MDLLNYFFEIIIPFLQVVQKLFGKDQQALVLLSSNFKK